MAQRLDRAAEDVGSIVKLEHVNVLIPDQQAATLFYIAGLGLTRDPYLMTSTDNMWVNVGANQFHLPTGPAQRLRGVTGLVVPDRKALLRRLTAIRPILAGTCFAWHEAADFVETTCPWGNRIRCHSPVARFHPIFFGMPYVEFDVPGGTAAGIAAFYRRVLGAPANLAEDRGGHEARVRVGPGQELVFRETDTEIPAYDGHHIQIYVADFSGPYRRLDALGLITQEDGRHQYRFVDIVDPDSGMPLFRIEHEVRSLTHPLYGRSLVNRNPAQTQQDYRPGRDAWPGSEAMPG